MEQGPGHFFIISSSFHFFNNTDHEEYFLKTQYNFLQIKTPEVLVLYKQFSSSHGYTFVLT